MRHRGYHGSMFEAWRLKVGRHTASIRVRETVSRYVSKLVSQEGFGGGVAVRNAVSMTLFAGIDSRAGLALLLLSPPLSGSWGK